MTTESKPTAVQSPSSAAELTRQARRLQRIAACWQADEPSQREVEAAWRHLSRRKLNRRRLPRMRLVPVTLALLLATGGAFALGGVAYQRLVPFPQRPLPGAAEPEPSCSPARHRPQDLERHRIDSMPPEAVDTRTPTPTESQATVTPALTATPPRRSSGTAASAPKGWSKAAEALREGDDVAARASLRQLAQSRDPASRDAARLALAQLDVVARRFDRARPTLRGLSQSGATPLIRRRAREMLASQPE